ncbi:MAG: WecB/TagA/CpsF family glycosyltransferase [Reichenbachiella sp.]
MSYTNHAFLDINVHAVNINDVLESTTESIKTGSKSIISNHNLHSLYLIHFSEKRGLIKEFYKKSNVVLADGMSIILLGKLFGHKSLSFEHRNTYLDIIHPLLNHYNEQCLSLFYLGSTPEASKVTQKFLNDNYPKIRVTTNDGFFDASNDSIGNRDIVDKINSKSPNILMVGMGMPRQEIWVVENINDLNVNVVMNCGACFDYLIGFIATPPRWMGKIGLEWFFRLLDEPTRLYKRYLYEPFKLIPLIIIYMVKKLLDKNV